MSLRILGIDRISSIFDTETNARTRVGRKRRTVSCTPHSEFFAGEREVLKINKKPILLHRL
jgi:hypothetical protein